MSGTVFHYTDAAGLLGILGSGTLRASSFQSLNDSSELRYGVDLIRDVFKTAELVGDPVTIALLSDFIDNLDEQLLERDYFIVCASQDGDSLNQWRNYASGNGYALALKTMIYAQVINREHDFPQKSPRVSISLPVWVNVIYSEDLQRTAALTLLQELVVEGDSALDDAIRHNNDPVDSLLLAIGTFVAKLKHPAFEVEREVRLIVDRDRFARPAFHAGRAGIVPYIEVGTAPPKSHPGGSSSFSMVVEREELAPLPIEGIICGPGEEFGRERRRRVAEALMTRHGYDVDVDASLIPLVT